MNINQATKRELARWYPLMDHNVQLELITDEVRFKVVPAGRRSGKSERFKRFMARKAMDTPNQNLFIGAPTRDQVKRIYWNDMKLLSLSSIHDKKPSETEMIIHYPNGSTIQLVGLDKPERFEGIDWTGGGIDEIANVKEKAWAENIKPALDTFNPLQPDHRVWCWFLGVPEGLNHYYDMAQYALNNGDPDWKLYTWKSSDILPPDVIASAKRLLSKRQYRQEYEASFETVSGRIYEDYNKENHTSDKIKKHEQILWMHDQNFTPLSSAIAVIRKEKRQVRDSLGLIIVGRFDMVDTIHILDEIVLSSAISKQSALEFVEKYKKHKNKSVLIYGDPAGRQGEKHGHASDYTELEAVLATNGWEFERRVSLAAPAIKDRQNSLRALICNATEERRLYVNPNKAEYVDKGLSTVQTKKGSSFQEDQSNEYQHITTAVGYMTAYEYPVDDMVLNLNMSFTT